MKVRNPNAGFTLVEIMLVAMVIAVLAVVALMLINPAQQRHRIWDVERKRELEQLRILFDNYYLENLQYPTDQQVCYDTAQNDQNGICSCHICGLVHDSGTFSSLVKLLYCDPQHPSKEYLYTYDCTNPFPLWYAAYAELGGPSADSGGGAPLTCNYAVSNDHSRIQSNPPGCTVQGQGFPAPTQSQNPTPTPGGGPSGPPPTATPTPPACADDPTAKYCKLGGICNICGEYSNCLNQSSCDQPPLLFSDSQCQNRCQNFGAFGPTSTPIPTPTPFQLGSCPLDPDPKYCNSGGSCNNCGLYQNCLNSLSCDQPLILFGNATCNGICYEE